MLAAVLLAALAPLTAWSEGYLDIHHISTGRGNQTFFVLPDGTTLLVDTGNVTGDIPDVEPRPDATRPPAEWVARYIERHIPGSRRGAAIDYALVTHFHGDHMAGIDEVGRQISIGKLIDRGYDYPAPLDSDLVDEYRRFANERSIPGERFVPGRNDQIVLARPESYPSFEIRNLTANGEAWTGVGTETRHYFPPIESLDEEDYPTENMCSLSFRLSYGAFDYFTGGDLTGTPNVGHPEWQNMERAIATVVGPLDVHVVNHHGSIDPATPEFLAATRPRVHIIPAWSPTHPAPSVLKRLMEPRAYPGPRDVFILALRDPTKRTIGARARRVQSDRGHVVVRVEPGGARYEVFVVSDADESDEVLSRHGPYASR